MSLHSMLEELEFAKFGRVLPLPLFCLFCILIWAVSVFSLSCFAGSLYGSSCLLININPSQKKNVVSIGITPIKLA